jgi:hypothetical protein
MHYPTQDIAFASFLVQHGVSIVQVARSGRRVSWVFNLSQEELEDYEAKWPLSESARFFTSYQTLKSQLRKP